MKNVIHFLPKTLNKARVSQRPYRFFVFAQQQEFFLRVLRRQETSPIAYQFSKRGHHYEAIVFSL